MVKFVIAGPADCPYFAKIEVLAQTMKSVLPDFDYRAVLVSPKEWNTFVDEICISNRWNKVRRSPLIWREPLEFGGPKLYFGSFNEFQEYAYLYYGIENTMSSNDMKQLAESNFNSRIKETVVSISTKSNLIVTIIFAGSELAYYFIPLIANGTIFPDNHIIYVRLFDNTEVESSYLDHLVHEIEDMSSPFIRQITIHKKHLSEAVDGAHVVVIFPSISKMEDLIREPELKKIGHVIFNWAVDEVKVLVVYQCVRDTDMNLCNLRMSLTSVLPPENILAVTGTLMNRGKRLLAEQLNINSNQISNLLFWGFCSKSDESFIVIF
ncbi:hypothetical protein HELRODRAFT_182368 [Helobdella robusta]|uniref:Uncharacterized protein n=1 Tax=Helobdella robusta TaxID=6412 RepID=T1FI41_HELRO|nr:hypothetical protein HELRODRAFT_182368 [Helobdella robusta]ESN91021.1 hypothetical protein HELRODRAFT_182368 [Helobdella robusta]